MMRIQYRPVLTLCIAGLSTLAMSCVPGGGGDESTSAATATGEPVGVCAGLTLKTGLQLWLDAGSLSVGDGGSVSTWNDCANGAVSATSSAASSQPTYSASGGPSDRPYLTFDGTADHLKVASGQVAFPAGATIFMLAQYGAYPGAGGLRYVIDRNATGPGFSMTLNTDSTFLPFIGGLGSGEGGVYAASTWYLTTFVAAGTTVTEYQNGLPTGLANAGTYTDEAADLYLFARRGALSPTRFTAGKLAEVIMYDGALSDADRMAVQCYLSSKYQLGITLCD